MSALEGTYRQGHIVLDQRVDWAEGTRVIVERRSEHGLLEGVWPDDGSPEGQAEILRRMEALATAEPLELTPEEETEIVSAREVVRQATLEAVRKEMGLAP